MALSNFSRIRDYHSLNASNSNTSKIPVIDLPNLIIMNIFVNSVNATLVTNISEFKSRTICMDTRMHPKVHMIYNTVTIIPDSKLVLEYWQDFYPFQKSGGVFTATQCYTEADGKANSHLPIFTWVGEISENFMYCGIPKKLTIFPRNSFTLFAAQFNYRIWIMLCVSFITVATIVIVIEPDKDRFIKS